MGAIETALQQNLHSPMTRAAIGPYVLRNQALKSQIAEFKDRVITSTLSVEPQLLHASVFHGSRLEEMALSLLNRATGFVRQKLPDTSARLRLIDLLAIQWRIGSSAAMAKELAKLLEDEEDVKSVLKRCRAEDSLRLEWLFDASINSTCPPPVCSALGQAFLDCPEPRSVGYQMETTWKVSVLLSEVQHEPWTFIAARFLIVMWTTKGIDISQVRTAILKQTVAVLKQPCATILQELRGFHCRPYNGRSRAFISLRLESAANGSSDYELMRRSVVLNLARRGSLLFDDARGCATTELCAIAEQLEQEKKFNAGAQAAVFAGVIEEAMGNLADAAQMFIYARSMEPTNPDATEGVLRTAPALGRQCKALQQRCRELRNQRAGKKDRSDGRMAS